MAKINLLPWRAELREQRKKEFITLNVAIFLLAVVCSGLVWMFFNAKLNDQMTANQQITSANTALDARLKDLDGLQAQRDEILEVQGRVSGGKAFIRFIALNNLRAELADALVAQVLEKVPAP